MSPKKSVFISHASKNFAIADELRVLLEKQGISCWIAPRDIPPSSSYGQEIASAIEACSVTVLVLTDDANISRAVANELELSFAKEKVIIPLRLKNIKPSKQIEFFVSNAQWVDAFYTPLKQRVRDIVAVVLAVERHTAIPNPTPEKKTFIGQLEKSLEQCLRYKMLTAVSLAIFLVAISLMSYFGIYKVNHAIDEERRLINQDPSIIGLMSAKGEGPLNTSIPGDITIDVSLYNNLKNTANSEINAVAVVKTDSGERGVVNLKSLLPNATIRDAQIIEFKVPKNSRQVLFCLTAPHPESKERVSAIWSYQIVVEGKQFTLFKEGAPVLVDSQSKQGHECD
ncbi:toll/interleukin-1 receptor domain-containing protein [Polynucleobacter sp. JS-Polo-80-F4]|uniref:toll/interleukin-1 receptor domain-containing protein n=1 Tax=Polynucleobacter sp. JS-Polo-80-F4 TaxID=2576918 RepID=UPI001C0D714C|nr:toll/interleukin-1 receptor domain-containing protein [Polynucleobacter sp. JS-Polo-80-F4]MBU3615847.1 toll/interleukin-1 receptor domain-containing protein [Polynucleobacter sp. JS-Polo-80-F4]